jgi:MGT family glycosyltransferase
VLYTRAMRVLFYNIKGAGHVNPTLPLVSGLVRRGHDVHYTVTTEWRDRIAAAGATFRNTAEGDAPFSTGDYNSGRAFPVTLFPAAAAVTPRLAREAAALAPDVVVYDSFAPWGLLVARSVGCRAVCSISGLVTSEEEMVRILGDFPDDEANRAALGAIESAHGVRFRREDTGRVYAEHNLVYSSPALNPARAGVPDRTHFVGPLARAPHPAAELATAGIPAAPPAGARRVYVSMGTVVGAWSGAGPAFFRIFVDALGGDARFEVVISTGEAPPDALGPLPPNVIARRHVPQVALLDTVSTFVTHTGANSMHEALFHDVPLVCVPFFGDQHANAARVTELGAGTRLAAKGLTAEQVRGAVLHVHEDPSYRAAARRLGDTLRRTGGLEQALGVVEGSPLTGRAPTRPAGRTP